ncbi:serine hydrolase [Plantactinospora siamensis]|uniref:Serine hydrolase n=1 Tax=Plantactinospora siamensis TaxID=555372 RepID=A0ABV6NZ95_9ACTN
MIRDRFDAELAAAPGTASAYVGRLTGPPAYARLADTPHYAASTMKLAVLAALYRAAEDGSLDLDRPVPVRNDFASAAPGAGRFGCDPDYDNDDAVWARVGGEASLRWLADRMVTRSSNLATNVVLGYVGLPAVARAWAAGGARHSVTGRGIEDFAARERGITNDVTAADLAALLGAIARGADEPGGLAGPASCSAMLSVLFGQVHREDLAAGLPEGTRIAHKNGWVNGVRHGAGVVFPADAPPYLIVVCTTVDLDGPDHPDPHAIDAEACAMLARLSAAAWADRHVLGADTP